MFHSRPQIQLIFCNLLEGKEKLRMKSRGCQLWWTQKQKPKTFFLRILQCISGNKTLHLYSSNHSNSPFFHGLLIHHTILSWEVISWIQVSWEQSPPCHHEFVSTGLHHLHVVFKLIDENGLLNLTPDALRRGNLRAKSHYMNEYILLYAVCISYCM